jgi:hypothetical protein
MKEINLKTKIPWFQLSEAQKRTAETGLAFSVVVGAVVIWQFFDFETTDILVGVFFCLALLWRIPSRFSAVLALGFLISCPVFLMLKKTDWAETMAVATYYFLAIAVILQIVEFNRKPRVESVRSNAVRGVARKGKKIFGRIGAAIARLSDKKKLTKRSKKQTIYILMVAFLLLETAIIFFSLSVAMAIFWYVFVLVALFPKRTLWPLFFITCCLAVISAITLILSQEDLTKTLYFWIIMMFALIVEALIVGRLGRK